MRLLFFMKGFPDEKKETFLVVVVEKQRLLEVTRVKFGHSISTRMHSKSSPQNSNGNSLFSVHDIGRCEKKYG
jgi:hypothetical protein